MSRFMASTVGACLLIAGLGAMASPGPVAGADDPPKASADRRFEALWAEARKAPEKADWKALRAAFAETSHYRPYDVAVTEKLREIAEAIGRGETKEGESALLGLLERERSMRLDTVAMLMFHYRKTKQKEKAEAQQKIVEGILGVLKVPKAGTSFEAPIDVLFIDEEYFVTDNMPVAGRGSVVKDGHHFDVFEIEPAGDQPARKVHFRTDLPRKALSRDLEGSK